MKLKLFIILLSTMYLVGCGFHLRGVTDNQQSSNLKNVSVYLAVADGDDAFHRQLQRELQITETRLLDDVNQADWHLVVLSVKTEKKSVGIDDKGRSNEYEINMKVEFIIGARSALDEKSSANDTDDNRLTFSIRRNVYFDNNDQIGQRNEEINILKTMREELSRRLVSALSISIVK